MPAWLTAEHLALVVGVGIVALAVGDVLIFRLRDALTQGDSDDETELDDVSADRASTPDEP